MSDYETIRAALREWKPMRALLTETGKTSPELALDRIETRMERAAAAVKRERRNVLPDSSDEALLDRIEAALLDGTGSGEPGGP